MSEMDASEVVALLRDRHYGDGWVLFPELRVGTGFGKDAEPRLDLWAIRVWGPATANYMRVAYEIKVSRSDFLSEIKKPAKRRHAILFSNEFWFVAPAGVAKAEEIPTECGFIEIRPGETPYQRLKIVVPAPFRESIRPTWRFVAAIARRTLRGEALTVNQSTPPIAGRESET